MIRYFRLRDGVPVREYDLLAWARWFGGGGDGGMARRSVGLDRVGDLVVSTVFLGVDHGPGVLTGRGRAILWETMTFPVEPKGGRGCPVTCDRCGGTAVDALAMHGRVLARVHAGAIQPWGEVDA